jgi:hypothetical protein
VVAVTGEEAAGGTEMGHFSRYRDPITALLGGTAANWERIRKARQAIQAREREFVLDTRASVALSAIEDELGRQLGKLLRQHPLWPWLGQYPGLRGVHTARLIGRIGDPLRFPGRLCAAGHYLPADWSGSQCPVEVQAAEQRDENGQDVGCLASIGPLRLGTGVASLWHYCGMHVVNGRAARKVRGVRATWDPIARTCLMMPGGIAEQIVRHRVPVYRERYDEARERLQHERGDSASEPDPRPAPLSDEREGEPDRGADIRLALPLRPFQIDRIARTIAVKVFVGDLLTEWKRCVGAERLGVNEDRLGSHASRSWAPSRGDRRPIREGEV